MSLRHLLSRSRLLCCLLVFSYLFILPTAHAEPKRFALVIGNTDYSGQLFTHLQNSVNDAEAMTKTLTSLGFEVFPHTNIDGNQFYKVRNDFEQRLKQQPDSIVLVYFSGHGLQGSDGENYLIPLNTHISYHEEVAEQGIGISKTLEAINANHPKMTIFIVDACREGITLPSRDNQKGVGIKGTMSAMSGAEGSLIAFAASPNQTALDFITKSDTHSIYTGALLKNLTNPKYNLEQVFKKTREQVSFITEKRQIPAETSMLTGDDFYFSAPDRGSNSKPTNTVNQATQPVSEPSVPVQPAKPIYENKPLPPTLVQVPVQNPIATTNSVPKIETFTVNDVNFDMVAIKGGTFQMGSPTTEKERSDNETLHEVTVSNFQMGQTEVTQKQWQAVMGTNPSSFKGQDLPVDSVSWNDAQAFITRLKQQTGREFRLPTEAEWEYASRSGTTTPFSFGDNISPEQVNYDGNYPYSNGQKGEYRQTTIAVKSLPANAWGLYEMHGNVLEWCSDWYGDYSTEAVTNPTGATNGMSRVLRGGSWYGSAWNARSAFRYYSTPDYGNYYVGFRFALGQPV